MGFAWAMSSTSVGLGTVRIEEAIDIRAFRRNSPLQALQRRAEPRTRLQNGSQASVDSLEKASLAASQCSLARSGKQGASRGGIMVEIKMNKQRAPFRLSLLTHSRTAPRRSSSTARHTADFAKLNPLQAVFCSRSRHCSRILSRCCHWCLEGRQPTGAAVERRGFAKHGNSREGLV